MRYEHSAVGCQLTLLIEELDLPVDEIERDCLLKELETALGSVLANHGLDADSFRAIGGHTYSAIKARCPECRTGLTLIEPSLDASNGSLAAARCKCGWYGDAVYRLIDLHEITSSDENRSSMDETRTSDSIFDDTCSVAMCDIEPRYYPY